MNDLDDRVLGQRGLLVVAALLALVALIGGIAVAVRSDVAAAVVAFLVAAWAGFWTLRRWRTFRA